MDQVTEASSSGNRVLEKSCISSPVPCALLHQGWKSELTPCGLFMRTKAHRAPHDVLATSTGCSAALALGGPIALNTRISWAWEHGFFEMIRLRWEDRGALSSGSAPGMLWLSSPRITISPNTVNIWNCILVRLKLYFSPKHYLSLCPWRGCRH